MSAPDLSLLGKRRFWPIFVVQFLGAFNDNLLKFAIFLLANFTIYAEEPAKAEQLATLATGLFILPYLLVSAAAGQLADAYDKARLVRLVKIAEILFMGVGFAGFWLQSIPLLLLALFLSGFHSAVFGPVKYSILPQHLAENEVVGGTGIIEAGTFLAILGGQLLANIVRPWEAGLIATSLAFIGFLASLAIPAAPAGAPGSTVDFNLIRSSWHVLKLARRSRAAWLAILGISWFFAVGAVILSEFAPLVSDVLVARQEVATLFLLVFSFSVAAGSIAVGKLLNGEVSARYVPISALALAVFLIDLWISASGFNVAHQGASIRLFLASPGSWHILFALAGISFAGGMFIVPLYAILQMHSPPESRSQIIAANNIVNAALTVALVSVVGALIHLGIDVPGIIGVMGFATLIIYFAARSAVRPSTANEGP